MIRDFSYSKMAELQGQISKISDEQFLGITDFFGDVAIGLANFVGLIKLDEDMSNVQKYHKYVLDQHNTTVEDLKKILTDVACVDMDYKRQLNEINNNIVFFKEFVKKAADMLDYSGSDFDVEKIKKYRSSIRGEIEQYKADVKAIFEYNLDEKQKHIMHEAGKGIVKGLFDVTADICKILIAYAEGDVVGLSTEIWGTINDCFALGADIGVLFGLCMNSDIEPEMRYLLLNQAESQVEAEGLADFLESIGVNKGVVDSIKAVDCVVDTADILDGLYGSMEETSKLQKIFEETDGNSMVKLTKVFGKIKDNLLDNLLCDSESDTLTKVKYYTSNISKVINISTITIEDGMLKGATELWGESKFFDWFSDVVEVGEDMCELDERIVTINEREELKGNNVVVDKVCLESQHNGLDNIILNENIPNSVEIKYK